MFTHARGGEPVQLVPGNAFSPASYLLPAARIKVQSILGLPERPAARALHEE